MFQVKIVHQKGPVSCISALFVFSYRPRATCGQHPLCAHMVVGLCSHNRSFKKIWLNLLEWHWLIKLYRFQVYNSITHHLYVVLCIHHPQSSLLPSLFIPPSPTPFSPSDNHHTFVCLNKFFCMLTSFIFFTQCPNPPPSNICQSVFWIWVFFYFVCLFFFY